MSKYIEIQSSIFSFFASTTWQNEDIKTVPQNYTGDLGVNEFVRVNIIHASGNPIYQNLDGMSGLLIVDIFVPSGTGPLRASQIAGILDDNLQGVTIDSVQFTFSNLSSLGRDRDNPSLDRSQYTIFYKYNGA